MLEIYKYVVALQLETIQVKVHWFSILIQLAGYYVFYQSFKLTLGISAVEHFIFQWNQFPRVPRLP